MSWSTVLYNNRRTNRESNVHTKKLLFYFLPFLLASSDTFRTSFIPGLSLLPKFSYFKYFFTTLLFSILTSIEAISTDLTELSLPWILVFSAFLWTFHFLFYPFLFFPCVLSRKLISMLISFFVVCILLITVSHIDFPSLPAFPNLIFIKISYNIFYIIPSL